MPFSLGERRWWVTAYLVATLASTTGWLVLGQRLAEQTGLRRQVWLDNDFQGRPVIDDVARAATLDFLEDDPRLPREFISARWHGYWYVPSRQSFVVHVHADDYADVWINGELVFARSSAAARAVSLDAGVHELHITFQQYAGAANLQLYERSGNAYPLPLRTGYLFPSAPESDLLRLATIVDRLKLAVSTLLAVGVLGAAVLIVRRRRAAVDGNNGLAAASTRLDAAVLTVLCLAVLLYSFGNLSLNPATADGLQILNLGIRLAHDGTYRRWDSQLDEHVREPLGPSLIAVTDLASRTLRLGAVSIECFSTEGVRLSRSEQCRRQYVPYQATNLILLVLGAVGAFWLVLRLTGSRTLAYLGFLLTAQSGTLLASAGSFYTEVHAATLMVAVGGLAWVTATSRRLVHAGMLGLAMAALVLTKVVFSYLWIPVALTLAATDRLRRRVDWTTAGVIGVMLLAHGLPVLAWMTRNYLVSRDFSVTEGQTHQVLTLRAHYNTMRHDEWVAGFTYYLPPTGESPWLASLPRESLERFEGTVPHGFRVSGLDSSFRQESELQQARDPGLAGIDSLVWQRSVNDELAGRARALLFTDPLQHLKVGLLLAWRGTFIEEGFGFLSDPLAERLSDVHGYSAWPRWRRAYGANAATLVNLAGLLALVVVPFWLWLGRGRFEALLIFLPALYAHGAYSMASHFLPRYGLPQVPLRVVATLVLLFLVWSSLRRIVRRHPQ